ncbi:unnamed protein product, partial [Oncorhynchus mykiss]
MVDLYAKPRHGYQTRGGLALPIANQVDNESAQNAVYVNVAELHRNVSESPLSASSPPCSPPYLDSEGWEVHTDQESGQEYYYHPESGQTTWDNPHIDPEAPAEEPVCSSPSPSSQSPTSTSVSHPAWTADWEQCLDVTSGRQYFYNPVSGETSWEPPEPQCPYPPLMEPLSGHSSLEEGPPPLPEEDYPAEADLPESLEEEPLALSPVDPHSFHNDYNPSHVIQAVIPRASLDRSAPTGWNLNVDPDGTWVFSSKHSPEQWIKSLDDRGQTYYYLRDGSRSQWNLPEAPVASGQSKVGNGVALDGGSLSMKNWRHTMGPAHFSSTMEERKFFPNHRRKASDYGSEGSSADNSPEMGQHHVSPPPPLLSSFIVLPSLLILISPESTENDSSVKLPQLERYDHSDLTCLSSEWCFVSLIGLDSEEIKSNQNQMYLYSPSY